MKNGLHSQEFVVQERIAKFKNDQLNGRCNSKGKMRIFFYDSFFRELMKSFYLKNNRYGEYLLYELDKEKIV